MSKLRIALTALAAASLLALSSGAVHARWLSLSSQTFRATWARYEYIEDGEEGPITCPVTLEGSFHSRTIAKVVSALVGYITRAVVGSCPSGGEVIVLTESLPWHLRYSSFTGTLPNITSVHLGVEGYNRLISSIFGLHRCLYIFPREAPGGLILNLAAGVVQSIAIDESLMHRNLKFDLSFFFCRARLVMRGTGAVTVLNSSTRITVTLI